MTIHRLVVFSGFDTRLIEKVRHPLRSRQTASIFTKLNGEVGPEYFQSLLTRIRNFVDEICVTNDVRVIAVVASCIADQNARSLERVAFCPAFRRISFPSSWARDLNRHASMLNRIGDIFTSQDFLETYNFIKGPSNVPLALPLRNADCRQLIRDVDQIYELQSFVPSSGLDKRVTRLKRARGLRVNGVDFLGRMNNPSHPIRRCTDSVGCDVAARLRLGFSVPSRFEFDVTCENGLAGKLFYLCDGTAQRVPSGVTHLNMRMNDDHKYGHQ